MLGFVLLSFTVETVSRLLMPAGEELVINSEEAEEQQADPDKFSFQQPAVIETVHTIIHLEERPQVFTKAYLLPPAHTKLPELPPRYSRG